MKKVRKYFFAVMAVALAAGCTSDKVGTSKAEGDDDGMHKDSYSQYELNNGDFKMTYVKAGDEAFRIVSITNLRSDVTTVDLRKFGNAIFEHLLSPKLQKGEDLTPEDEDTLYFSLDIWVGTMNDVTTYVAKRMRPDNEYDDVPDDFGDEAPFIDVTQKDIADQKRVMSAVPREELRRVRELCARNLGDCDMGRTIQAFGEDFWLMPREVFLYQIACVQGELSHHKEKRYLEPRFGNLWGLLKTNDPELKSYAVTECIVKNRKAVDQKLARTFKEMDAMVGRVRKALAATGDKKSRDILRDVYEEFGRKNSELKGNLDIIIVDIPVAIYAKIALNKIDEAKGTFNDSEEQMVVALERFHARTENGKLISRVKSQSAHEIIDQLVDKARAELGDKEVERIMGRCW